MADDLGYVIFNGEERFFSTSVLLRCGVSRGDQVDAATLESLERAACNVGIEKSRWAGSANPITGKVE